MGIIGNIFSRITNAASLRPAVPPSVTGSKGSPDHLDLDFEDFRKDPAKAVEILRTALREDLKKDFYKNRVTLFLSRLLDFQRKEIASYIRKNYEVIRNVPEDYLFLTTFFKERSTVALNSSLGSGIEDLGKLTIEPEVLFTNIYSIVGKKSEAAKIAPPTIETKPAKTIEINGVTFCFEDGSWCDSAEAIAKCKNIVDRINHL